MTPLEAALKYASGPKEKRFRVLPVWWLLKGGKECACPPTSTTRDKKTGECKSAGKHAMLNGWQKNATCEPTEINKLWARHPNAYVGIMPPPGHSIIDVDPRNGGKQTLATARGKHKLPDTVIQRSGGGGVHLFFEGEPTGKIGDGIDIKRNGRGYVVAYPSPHSSGGKYAWKCAPWDGEMQPLPDWLAGGKPKERFKGDEFGAVEGSEEASGEEVVLPKVPLEKMREALAYVSADDYARWINIGQALRHAYGAKGEKLWTEWSRTSSKFNDGDEDKWSTFDRNRDRPLITIRSIMSVARRSGYRPLTVEFAQGLWAQADVDEYFDGSAAEEIMWAFHNCIPCGKVTLLAGAGGSSKSFLTLTMAIQLAMQEALGPFTPGDKPGKALLMVAEEDKQDIKRRIHAISGQAYGEPRFSDAEVNLIRERLGVVSVRGMDWRLLYHDEAGDLHETERVDYLIEEIKSIGDVRFLVLDPLVAFNGAEENSNIDMARLMLTLDRIAMETGAAVLVVHHVSKGGQITSMNDATQAVVRGATALVDNARSAILLTRMPRMDAPLYNVTPEDAGRYVMVRFIKNNYGAHMGDTVFVVERGGALRHAPEISKVHTNVKQATQQQDETSVALTVLRTLREQPDMSQADIVTATSKSRSAIHRAMQTMQEEEQIKRAGVGKGSTFSITKAGHKTLEQAQGIVRKDAGKRAAKEFDEEGLLDG